MCRSTDYHGFNSATPTRLKIREFLVRFSGSEARKPLPKSLTLIYLPRINGNELEIDGSKIRPDSPAFVSLHRGVVDSEDGEAAFGSRDRVLVDEGVRFEVYLGEEKVLKGSFWRDYSDEWRLECRCALENEVAGAGAKAEVRVEAEGHVAMSERVAMVARRKRGFSNGLEEIPEEREVDADEEEESSVCGSNCSSGEPEFGSDGGHWGHVMDDEDEMDMEGVRWAVDVGIWVMCLGVGLLVSKASSKTLRRRRLL
ncbi:NADP-specific glutamate dehydrogenase [Parasponia andersonii]|uniref:NADP-specific glutamate dehydrogenase n=1 Tax=Parasponia andersonii TaxID=3476 RepID=A0A2P5DJV3_PARAD|nr:NADP-specific glutamate dehydrogenase [Parasponia andersonii]